MLCALTATGFRNWLFQDPPSTSQRGTHWYAGSRTKRAPSQEPLCTNLQYRTNSLFVIAGEENTLAQKWEASIEVACFFFFFQPGDTDGEVFSTPPQPAAHPRLPYVFCQGPLPVPLIEYSEYWATVSIIHQLPGRPDWIHRQNSH